MGENFCKSCEHFRQHYSLNKEKICWVYCGHCVVSARPKRKKTDTAACEQFVPVQSKEDPFVDREYLSKAILEYVLRMKLFPAIEGLPENRTE